MLLLLHRSAPPKAKFYSVQSSDKVQYHLLQSKKKDPKALIPLDENSVIYVTMTSPSEKENEDKVKRLLFNNFIRHHSPLGVLTQHTVISHEQLLLIKKCPALK